MAIMELDADAEPSIDAIARQVLDLLESSGRQAALRYAMSAVEPLLRTPSDALRVEIRDRVFKRFDSQGVAYQPNDFEVVDYDQYELSPDLHMLRGPALSPSALKRGDYFCVVGAAQTFGRLVRNPWPNLLSEAIDLPVLNLGRGGAGPDIFLNPVAIKLMRRARFVILQAMSGRSVGCDEYPGGRLIERDGKPTKLNRLDLLEHIFHKDPKMAYYYINLWNRNYLEFYKELRTKLNRPTAFLWISDRKPGDWAPEIVARSHKKQKPNFGSFPHLIGIDLYNDVASLFDRDIKFLYRYEQHKTYSRITGEACPHFSDARDLHAEFRYYPSAEDHRRLAEALTPWARKRALLARRRKSEIGEPSSPVEADA